MKLSFDTNVPIISMILKKYKFIHKQCEQNCVCKEMTDEININTKLTECNLFELPNTYSIFYIDYSVHNTHLHRIEEKLTYIKDKFIISNGTYSEADIHLTNDPNAISLQSVAKCLYVFLYKSLEKSKTLSFEGMNQYLLTEPGTIINYKALEKLIDMKLIT